MHSNYVCFTKFPNINDLLCVFATIDLHEKVNTSHYNLTIKKCRQLIFENDNVAVAPVLDQIYGMYIAVTETYYQTGELQKFLKTLNLRATTPTSLKKYIYEDCCTYTISAKLAPKWNIVSRFYVQGRDFLTNPNLKDCVKLVISINDKGNTSMIFEICRIKIPQLSLNKLELSEQYLTILNTNRKVIFKNISEYKTVRVLPSLKRGSVIAIHLDINPKWNFNSYNHFRRHWKNSYGYRLPESGENTFYLEIMFFDGSPIFTYPSTCVCPFEPTFARRVDPQLIVSSFICDLMRSVPNILGDKYPVPSHLNQPMSNLYSSTDNLENPNIRVNTIEIEGITDSQQSAIVYLPTQKTKDNNNCISGNTKSNLSQIISQINKLENKQSVYLTQQTPISQLISQSTVGETTQQQEKKSSLNENQGSMSKEINNQLKFLSDSISQKSNMSSKPTETVSSAVTSSSVTTEQNKPAKFFPIFTSKFRKINQINNIPNKDLSQKKGFKNPMIVKKSNEESTIIRKDDNQNIATKTTASKTVPESPKINEKISNNDRNTEKNIPHKRTLQNMTETPAKKSKLKSHSKEIDNMEEHVKNESINTLTAPLLLKWLKQKNIQCTTKDKKAVLVDKVKNYFSKK